MEAKNRNIFLFLTLINLSFVFSYGYPEDSCYKCFTDNYFGANQMYFCRHNTTGLTWGQCCQKGSSTSSRCNEMEEQNLAPE